LVKKKQKLWCKKQIFWCKKCFCSEANELMMLSMVDLKQKRFLNEQDFVQLFARNDRLCEDRAKYIFKLIDIDSDGRISYNEFLQIVRNRRLL